MKLSTLIMTVNYKQSIYFIACIFSLLLTFLFVGQFRDPEDGDHALFIKHRPALKHFFYSPASYYRFHPQKLSVREQEEEKAFQEFVAGRDLFKNGNTFYYFAFVLIQLTLTLFVSAGLAFFTPIALKNRHLVAHFLISIVTTAFGLSCILLTSELRETLLFSFLILLLNIVVMVLLGKIKTRLFSHK